MNNNAKLSLEQLKTRRSARQLRLAVITNVYKQNLLSDSEAKELLQGPLVPGDDSTIIDDSELLGDLEGLEKINKEYEMIIIAQLMGTEYKK